MGVSWGSVVSWNNHWTGSIFFALAISIARASERIFRSRYVPAMDTTHLLFIMVKYTTKYLSLSNGGVYCSVPSLYLPAVVQQRTIGIRFQQTPPELSKLELKTKLCFFRGRLRGKNPKRERYRSVEARPARGIRASGTRHKARHQWRLFLGMDEGMIRGGKQRRKF